MPELTIGQYDLVYNLMSLCIASMFAGALFLFFSRSQVGRKYRPALLISALVPAIACYHYFRIAASFSSAYTLTDGSYVASGTPFNDAYRYADWLLTVPLLMIELVAVLALSQQLTRALATKLSLAAALMIALGYPGEVSADSGSAWFWWAAAMVPFAYIIATLFTGFRDALSRQAPAVQPLFGKARALVLITWSFYPIAYLAPWLGLDGASGEVALQVGYTIADITAKVGLGLFIYFIAVAKTEADGDDGTIDDDHPAVRRQGNGSAVRA